MNGYFFKKRLNIIKDDLMGVVKVFFSGQIIPKYFSRSCIVLLSKVSNPNKLTNLRYICLNNFTSMIISKLVSIRLKTILPSLISSNQFVFVKGTSVSENIMVAQEIIHHILKPNVWSNIIIKHDMDQPYDRVSLSYIFLVLRKMRFDEIFIDMVSRIMVNNWHSLLSILRGMTSFIQKDVSNKVIPYPLPYLF